MQSSNNSQEFLGILRNPLGWLPSPPPAITYFIFSGHLSAFKPCRRPSGRRTWEHIGYNQDVVGHGDKAYLMRPVASVSLRMYSEVTACLRHQRHLSCVRAYGTLEMGVRLDKDYMEVTSLKELFFMVCSVEWAMKKQQPWAACNVSLQMPSYCIWQQASESRLESDWLFRHLLQTNQHGMKKGQLGVPFDEIRTSVEKEKSSVKWRLIKVGGSCLGLFSKTVSDKSKSGLCGKKKISLSSNRWFSGFLIYFLFLELAHPCIISDWINTNDFLSRFDGL